MWPSILFAAVSGLVAVALGAMAAHGLKARLDAEALAWIETGVRYQMWHALAMLGAGAFMATHPGTPLTVAAWGWAVGTVLFSGSLYLLAFTGMRGLGMVAPVGGLAFLIGWAALAWHAVATMRG